MNQSKSLKPKSGNYFSFCTVAFLFVLFARTTNLSAQSMDGNPLNGLETLKDYETRRASSSDKNWENGNADARSIKPGGTLTLAELEGPGKIVHIWFTIAHQVPYYSRLLTLRMYWDDEDKPSVECPIGDFFGIGHGLDKSFVSLPIRVSSDGRGRNCYWPMPFSKKARITVTNESEKTCNAFYYYIDWQKHSNSFKETAYFHAMYRQEYPCIMGRNYLIADLEGRGHYVGTIQNVYHSSPGWYGEGDDFFFIDGAQEPQLKGTGTEDYFCDGWGFRQQDGPFYGTPVWEGYNTGDLCTAYRWHIPDPVTFKKSLRLEIEHKGSQTFPDGKTSGFIEREDLMSSVAFWYQTEPHKPWEALPAGKNRLPFEEKTFAVGWKSVPSATHSEAPLEVQNIGGATDNKQLWFKPTQDNAWLELPITIEKDITVDLKLKMLHSWDYGTYRIKLDGKDAGTFDLQAQSPTPATHPLGMHTLSAGNHVLRFECVGKSDKSKGYLMGFDALIGRVPVYARPPDFDLRKIQVSAPK